MATGDETQAGPRPSLPPRHTPPPGPDNGIGPAGASRPGRDGFGLEDDPGETQRMAPDPTPPGPRTGGPGPGGQTADPTSVFAAGARPSTPGVPPVRSAGDGSYAGGPPPEDQLNRFGGPGPDPEVPFREPRVGKAQILAPQANEWETNLQEVEVVKSNRFGLALLFLLGLLVVAVVALGLAARSVFNSGDDVATTETIDPETAADGTVTDPETDVDQTPDTTALPDPNQLLISLTEDPFICDGGVRPFANLSGAAPGEEVSFASPQSSGILPGTAEADGSLTIRWQCDPEQVGTMWDIVATGVTSGKSVAFSITGADATGVTATIPGPTELTVSLIESPFICNGETRIFGGLTGAESNEEIAFTSPQASGIRNGQADADGSLSIRWQCDAAQAGMTWELTATGVTSGRSVTFTFSGA